MDHRKAFHDQAFTKNVPSIVTRGGNKNVCVSMCRDCFVWSWYCLTLFPSWFGYLTGGPESPVDIHEGIERRVRGGMLLGVGLVFLTATAIRPWSISIPSAIFSFMTGALAARIVGLLMDGAVRKQWLWVAVEAIVMALAAIWLWHNNGSTAP